MGRQPVAREMLRDLLADHESLIQTLRRDLDAAMARHGDAGTSDFLTGLMERHQKVAWMLRSFWKTGSGGRLEAPRALGSAGPQTWRCGSRRSRSPSPSRFAPSTTREIAMPGTVASHQALDR